MGGVVNDVAVDEAKIMAKLVVQLSWHTYLQGCYILYEFNDITDGKVWGVEVEVCW